MKGKGYSMFVFVFVCYHKQPNNNLLYNFNFHSLFDTCVYHVHNIRRISFQFLSTLYTHHSISNYLSFKRKKEKLIHNKSSNFFHIFYHVIFTHIFLIEGGKSGVKIIIIIPDPEGSTETQTILYKYHYCTVLSSNGYDIRWNRFS